MSGVPVALILSATFLAAGYIGGHLWIAMAFSVLAIVVSIVSRPRQS